MARAAKALIWLAEFGRIWLAEFGRIWLAEFGRILWMAEYSRIRQNTAKYGNVAGAGTVKA